MIDDFAKQYLHNDLRVMREAVLQKLDGLGEYDIRRPLTVTGTNLLGLVKHLALWESRYFGEVFGRPFPEALPRWDDAEQGGTDMWASEHETRAEIVDRYRRAWRHSDATITALAIDAPGHVPWWPRPDVKLFNILVHVLTETSRHAGHADILREELDGSTGAVPGNAASERDAAFWAARRTAIERAAEAAVADGAGGPFAARLGRGGRRGRLGEEPHGLA
ncbi:DinB family protein [Streptomyces sp. NPDC058284]|uniref:DinB family protein n=1 Tax=unclassified Streptomyces TaxID=2593676 RepID=UPI0036487580